MAKTFQMLLGLISFAGLIVAVGLYTHSLGYDKGLRKAEESCAQKTQATSPAPDSARSEVIYEPVGTTRVRNWEDPVPRGNLHPDH